MEHEPLPVGRPSICAKAGQPEHDVLHEWLFCGQRPRQEERRAVGLRQEQRASGHPNISYDFYKSIFGNAHEKWNMEMLFTDFLCYRGPEMGQYQDCGEEVEGAHKWLAGMTKAATDTGSEVQYCMALAHQVRTGLTTL